MTLESQYKSYLKKNPKCNYTFEEWKKKVLVPFVEEAMRQIEKIEKEKKEKEDL